MEPFDFSAIEVYEEYVAAMRKAGEKLLQASNTSEKE